jgi:hypothetical protein
MVFVHHVYFLYNQELTIHNQVKPNSCDAKAQAETATA